MWERHQGHRARREEEIARELRAHLEEEMDDLRDEGLSQQEAYRSAHRSFGNLLIAQENTRSVWGWGGMERFLTESRQAMRSMWRSPGFLAFAVVALALGIGATSAVFAIVHAVLLRPLPYPAANRLVLVQDQLVNDLASSNLASPGQYEAWSSESFLIEQMGAYTEAFLNAAAPGQEVERIPAMLVTPSLLELLGTELAQGRLLTEEQRSLQAKTIVISDSLWKRRFGDATLDGQTMRINEEPHEIVGVLPPDFFFFGRKLEAIRLLPPFSARSPEANRRSRYLTVVGRVQAGVTPRQAGQELSVIARLLGEQFPQTDANRSVLVRPLDEVIFGGMRSRLFFAWAAVASLLGIACLNVGGLFLARSLNRRDEIALRLSLGASRMDLFRQLFAEASVICLLGVTLGLAVAQLLLRLVLKLTPADLPRLQDANVGALVFLFAIVLGLTAAVAIAALPLRQMLASATAGDLKQSGKGNTSGARQGRTHGLLLGTEVAIALLLTIGAGLTVKALTHVLHSDPGFRAEGAAALQVTLSSRFDSEAQRSTFLKQLVDEVSAVPGVRAAGITNQPPLSGDTSTRPVNLGVAADAARQEMVEVRRISTRYQDAMGMRLVAGRTFSEHDLKTAPRVAMVNQEFARRFSPDGNVLGKPLFIQEGLDPQPAEIVGIIGDARHASLSDDAHPEVHIPIYAHPWHNVTMVVRSNGDPLAVLSAARPRIITLDPQMSVGTPRLLQDWIDTAAGMERFLAFLLGTFSVLAVFLASVGIYGVAAFVASRRTTEIGIRMALGATRAHVVRLVLDSTMRAVAVGIALGVLLSWPAVRVIQGILPGVVAADPFVYGFAILCFVATTVLACAPIAWKATSIDPAIAQKG